MCGLDLVKWVFQVHGAVARNAELASAEEEDGV